MRFPALNLTVREIKRVLLGFHKGRGYRIFEAFPLASTDPTVMFVNATITPFKPWFVDGSIHPDNYALIQGCFRMGGANELNVVGTNPYYFTFFEMFGSGTFRITHDEAVSYLLELLSVFGIEKERLYFTISVSEEFYTALKRSGIRETRIFQLRENKYFWQEWKFGVPGPVGHGLTVIFSRSSEEAQSVEQLADDQDRYVELLNLIYVHSQILSDGRVVPIANPGFDLGVGIERLAAVLQGCDSYHIDTIFPLVQAVNDFLSDQKGKPDDTIARICADHFRAIYVLLAQGLLPSNKGRGYVLRKLIRRFLETVWLSLGKPTPTLDLIQRLSRVFESCGYVVGVSEPANITDELMKEEAALLKILKRGEQIIKKHPGLSPHILHDTYGISKTLMTLIQQNQHNKKGGES
jgi:alanyl-tRNA synthetase